MPNLGFLKSGWGSWSNRFGASILGRNMATGAIGGAALGGIYGGLSNDSTFFRGALGGATLGTLGGFAAQSAGIGYRTFRAAGGGLVSRFSQAASAAGRGLYRDGRSSASFIGSTATRGYNSFKGIFAK